MEKLKNDGSRGVTGTIPSDPPLDFALGAHGTLRAPLTLEQAAAVRRSIDMGQLPGCLRVVYEADPGEAPAPAAAESPSPDPAPAKARGRGTPKNVASGQGTGDETPAPQSAQGVEE